MKRLDGQDVRNAYEVARRFNELAEEVGAKLDHLFERMDSIERLQEDKPEQIDWTEEDPGDCTECGAPYQIVRPGKTQSSCRCDEVRQLTEEVAELRRRLAEILAENERLRADNAKLACGYAERLGDHQENERLRVAAANWELVERMPLFMQIWPCGSATAGRNWAVQEAPGKHIVFASSPEAALRTALGEGK